MFFINFSPSFVNPDISASKTVASTRHFGAGGTPPLKHSFRTTILTNDASNLTTYPSLGELLFVFPVAFRSKGNTHGFCRHLLVAMGGACCNGRWLVQWAAVLSCACACKRRKAAGLRLGYLVLLSLVGPTAVRRQQLTNHFIIIIIIEIIIIYYHHI